MRDGESRKYRATNIRDGSLATEVWDRLLLILLLLLLL